MARFFFWRRMDWQDRWLCSFLLILVFINTIVASNIRYMLEPSAVEGIAWGHEWQWGYWKHPPIAAWLAEIGGILSPSSGWVTYLISLLCVAGGLVFVYRLALEMLPKNLAFCATLLTAAGLIYTRSTTILNPNLPPLLLWPGFIYYFYQSLNKGEMWYWGGLGIFAALCFLTKYHSGFLFFSAFLYVLTHKEYRGIFLEKKVYFSILLCLFLVFPHLVWIFDSDFSSIYYAAARVQQAPSFFAHLTAPLLVVMVQTLYVLPAILFVCFLKIKSKSTKYNIVRLKNRDFSFVLFMMFGPVCFFVLISLLMGDSLNPKWGVSLWMLLGIYLSTYLRADIEGNLLKKLAIFMLVALGIEGIGDKIETVVTEHLSMDPRDKTFPGPTLAEEALSYWNAVTHGKKLKYVGGGMSYGSLVAFYVPLAERPSVFLDFDLKHAPWINLQDVRKAGMLMVWDCFGTCEMPVLTTSFPLASFTTPHMLTLKRPYSQKVVKVCVAALLPEE